MVYPFYDSFKITSTYGTRTMSGKTSFHKGLDMVGLTDKNVHAIADGIIGASTMVTNKSNATWEWGNYVRVDMYDGNSVYFCHLSKRLVKKGDTVKAGDIIGIEGNTGYSFGSHCHVEIRKTGTKTNFNIADYLNIENAKGVYDFKTIPVKEEVGLMSAEYEELKSMIANLSAVLDSKVIIYNSIWDIPEWAKTTIQALMDEGIIQGEGIDSVTGNKILNISYDMVRMLCVLREKKVI